jgi:hypothetical protein
VYEGGNQSGRYNDVGVVHDFIARAGALGSLYKQRSPTMKEGDMSGFYYLMGPLGANPDPSAPHWGGQYRLVSSTGTSAAPSSFWSDLCTGSPQYPQYPGAQTVSMWRVPILDLWFSRMQWLW